MKVIGFLVLSVYIGFNLIVLCRYKASEMWKFLITEQNTLGRICGNIFYLPAWVMKFILIAIRKGLQKVLKCLRYCGFAIARFFQIIYHSVFDIV